MKKLLFVCVILLAGCMGVNKGSAEDVDSTSCEMDTLAEETDTLSKSLNDIRFGNYTPEDWLDNEYLSELRTYIDNYCKGEITNEELDPYKKYLKSQFVVLWAEPAIFGGMFVQFAFLDLPEHGFNAWVYSFVNEDEEKVTGYEVRSVHSEEEPTKLTKEEILETVKEHPELKLW